MGDLETFLRTYNIDEATFRATGLTWTGLCDIMAAYRDVSPSLAQVARDIAERCGQMRKVHSVRSRVKDPEHLAAKVVRKKIEKNADITLANYLTEVTDLIGVRVLHLFKEDWEDIHAQMLEQWALSDDGPTAYYREGDPKRYVDAFAAKGCQVRKHPDGYRSVHYNIVTAPTKVSHFVEVQVRTIFEEGWSEIDHRIRYPYDLDNEALAPFLVLFNSLAGQADEMGSYVTHLKGIVDGLRLASVEAEKKAATATAELRQQIDALGIEQDKRRALEEKLAEVDAARASGELVQFLPTDGFRVGKRPFSNMAGHWLLSSHGVIVPGPKEYVRMDGTFFEAEDATDARPGAREGSPEAGDPPQPDDTPPDSGKKTV